MRSLESLAGEAAKLAMGAPAPPLHASEAEAARVLHICNACRYCEGYCAVFPAMARRLEFGKVDINYLANLCHSCGACLHACQYAAPHEFAVNVPRAMALVRVNTYADYAWPAFLGALYRRNGLTVALAVAIGMALFLALALMMTGSLFHPPLAGNVYAVFPHRMLVMTFGAMFGYSVLALGMGARRFWRELSPGKGSVAAVAEAADNALRLKYLDGGHGQGCNERDDAFTLWRRRFHHLTFYGFLLCFASTCVATLYHYAFGWVAPYDLTSLPVLLGWVGGLGLLVGPAGLLWLGWTRDPRHGDSAQKPMDRGFIALLFLTSLTGLALTIWRDTSAMALLLAIHLGMVMALFLTLPYGKFAHGVFRCAALLRWSMEKRQPLRIRADAD